MRHPSRQTERGQAIAEYVLLVALIGVCLALVLGMVSKAASRAYHQSAVSLGQKVPNYGSSGGGGGVVLVGSSGGGGGGVKVPPASDPDSTGSGDSGDATDPEIPTGTSTQEASTAGR